MLGKKAQMDIQQGVAIFVLVVAIIAFFVSIIFGDLCTKWILGSAIFFFILWMLFDVTLDRPVEVGKLKFTLPLFIVLLLLYVVLKAMGICTPITQLVNLLTK